MCLSVWGFVYLLPFFTVGGRSFSQLMLLPQGGEGERGEREGRKETFFYRKIDSARQHHTHTHGFWGGGFRIQDLHMMCEMRQPRGSWGLLLLLLSLFDIVLCVCHFYIRKRRNGGREGGSNGFLRDGKSRRYWMEARVTHAEFLSIQFRMFSGGGGWGVNLRGAPPVAALFEIEKNPLLFKVFAVVF